jgi:hypothetical protein
MLIKNIRQFRTHWKVEQGYDMPLWNEHFIGSIHQEWNGFYKMVNGIVTNIRADMTPKLQNAQDEQAIYEFLQNAADCHSTECAIIYDENYLMVMNNGKPFSVADIKAILNSFQGTKADKTKPENCEKIGRYGIGFKLVYRLLGKSDGAEELFTKMAGPLLFSWYKPEQFEKLLNVSDTTVFEADAHALENEYAPWFVKIVLTCFPSAPMEEVLDMEHSSAVVFKQEEYIQLKAFLKRHEARIRSLSSQQGTLFFLKFGEKKHEKLKESLINVRSGISYSLNTLKTLNKVILQDEVIERFPLEKERFSISTGSDAFKKIDPEFPFCPIDIYFGYPADTQKSLQLKEAPNIYQYFPMRHERHKLAFLVHATSFMKVTDRTRLDDQGEANKETFIYLANALKERLNQYKKNDFQRYVQIYRVLLMSDAPDQYNSRQVSQFLYLPLMEYVKNNIPSQKNSTHPKDLLLIKATNIEVEPIQFGIGKEWFYWSESELEKAVIEEAQKPTKLWLKKWNLKDLILEGQVSLINNWITQLEDKEYIKFMEELKTIEFDRVFVTKFSQIQCFKFTNAQGESTYYALNDLQNNDTLFVVNQKTKEIRNELKTLGFSVLEMDVSDFAALLNPLKKQFDYLFDNNALIKKISSKTTEANLTTEQRKNIFQLLSNIKGVDINLIRELKLFHNQVGELRPLKSLLNPAAEIPTWLAYDKIAVEEYTTAVDSFLLQEVNYYTELIQPYWENIIQRTEVHLNITEFYQNITRLAKLGKGVKPVTDKKYIWINDEVKFATRDEIFYHKAMSEITEYTNFTTAVVQITRRVVPHTTALPFLEESVFKTDSTIGSASWGKLWEDITRNVEQNTLSTEQRLLIARFFRKWTDKAKMDSFKIFTSQANIRCAISQLIDPNENVPVWLESFKMNPEEYNEEWKPLLTKPENYFTSIVQHYTNELTKTTWVKEHPEEWYQEVKKLFEQNKTNKPFTNQSYIYINKDIGFVTPNQVFYHPVMSEADSYESLSKSIFKLTGLYAPHKNILPLLNELPFKIAEGLLQKLINKEEETLKFSEARNFIKFALMKNEPVFMYLYAETTENSDEIRIGKLKAGIVPCYAGKMDNETAQKLKATLPPKYRLLPDKLYFAQYSLRGLLTGKALMDEWAKLIPQEQLNQMLKDVENKDAQQLVSQNIQEIVIRIGQVYDTQDEVYKMIQILQKADTTPEEIQKKVIFLTGEGQHKLEEMLFSPWLTFNLPNNQKVRLMTEEILPIYRLYQQWIQQIPEQFPQSEAQWWQKKAFGNLKERDKGLILKEIKQHQASVQQSSTLAFLMLAAAEGIIKPQDLEGITVNTLLGEQPLYANKTYQFKDYAYLNPETVLQGYLGMEDRLGLTEKKPILSFFQSKVMIEPFIEKGEFYSGELHEDLSKKKELKEAFLSHLLSLWKKIQPESIVLANKNTDDWASIFQFSPKLCITVPEFARIEERTPEWLMDWVDMNITPDTEGFLQALGFHTSQSSVCVLRRYLLKGEGEVGRKNINEVAGDAMPMIESTIFWVYENNLTFSSNDERLQWLRRLFNALPELPTSLPLPCIKEVRNGEYVFSLQQVSKENVYFIPEARFTQFLEKYNLKPEKIIQYFSHVNKILTFVELKSLESKPIRIVEDLDVLQLELNSNEWQAEHYQQWKNVYTEAEIYLYNGGKIPYKLSLFDTLVHRFGEGDAVIDMNRIYVNDLVPSIEDALFEVTKRSSFFTNEHLLSLMRYKNKPSSTLQHQQTEENLAKNDGFTPMDDSLLAQLTQYLQQQKDYDISEWKPATVFGWHENIKRQGQTTTLLVKRHLNQHRQLSLQDREWKALQKGAEMIIFDGNNFKRYELGELLQNFSLKAKWSKLSKEKQKLLLELLSEAEGLDMTLNM